MMQAFWSAVITIVVMAIILKAVLTMLEPYAPWMALAICISIIGGGIYRRSRYW
jgi:hypothetical protein